MTDTKRVERKKIDEELHKLDEELEELSAELEGRKAKDELSKRIDELEVKGEILMSESKDKLRLREALQREELDRRRRDEELRRKLDDLKGRGGKWKLRGVEEDEETKPKAMLMHRIYLTASLFFPGRYSEAIQTVAKYSGLTMDYRIWLGRSFIVGLLLFLLMCLISFLLPDHFFLMMGAAFASFIVCQILSYAILYFKAERRARRAEESLPTVLRMISVNIRAGMTPFQALRLPKTGKVDVLQEEFEKISSKPFVNEDFADMILDVTDDIRLPILRRILLLFSRSIESGGRTAIILDEMARDITERMSVRREMKINVRAYMAFIVMSVMFGSPLLLALSVSFNEKIAEFSSELELQEMEGLPVFVGGSTIRPEFLADIAVVLIVATSLISCCVIGVINDGEEKYGLKYAPFMMLIPLALFYVARHFVEGMI